jgi:hypothetical protein
MQTLEMQTLMVTSDSRFSDLPFKLSPLFERFNYFAFELACVVPQFADRV